MFPNGSYWAANLAYQGRGQSLRNVRNESQTLHGPLKRTVCYTVYGNTDITSISNIPSQYQLILNVVSLIHMFPFASTHLVYLRTKIGV